MAENEKSAAFDELFEKMWAEAQTSANVEGTRKEIEKDGLFHNQKKFEESLKRLARRTWDFLVEEESQDRGYRFAIAIKGLLLLSRAEKNRRYIAKMREIIKNIEGDEELNARPSALKKVLLRTARQDLEVFEEEIIFMEKFAATLPQVD